MNPRGELKHYRVVKRFPAYDVASDDVKNFAESLAHLKSISRPEVADGWGYTDLFLEFKTDLATVEFPLTTDVIEEQEALVGGRRYQVGLVAGAVRESQWQARVTVAILAGVQPGNLPPDCQSFNMIDQKPLLHLECMWCLEEITETERYVTPCMDCARVICKDCLRLRFKKALRDHESMPARCCSGGIHPDIAKSVLTDSELVRYKLRFEEMMTSRPVYCAQPRCSVFIPPRKLHLDQGLVHCNACPTKTCIQCREIAEPGHRCSTAQSAEAKLLEDYNYQRCPRCGTGQAKIYGCNHIRCSCGGHWCWSCSVSLDKCQCDMPDPSGAIDQEPNEELDRWRLYKDEDAMRTFDNKVSTMNDMQNADLDENVSQPTGIDESKHGKKQGDDIEAGMESPHQNYPTTNDEMIDASIGQASVGPPSTHTTANTNIPPDSPPQPGIDLDQEHSGSDISIDEIDLNLNDEPDDRLKDPWTCKHWLNPLIKNHLPRHWMSLADPHWWDADADGTWSKTIDCMNCQTAAMIPDSQSNMQESGMSEEVSSGKHEPQWQPGQGGGRHHAHMCRRCRIILCTRCAFVLGEGTKVARSLHKALLEGGEA